MSPAPAAGVQRVLHIRPEPTENVTTDNMGAVLAELAPLMDACPDVYRGLARLCGADGHVYRLAVVFIDALSNAEMEFFSIAARVCRRTTVYVYGDDRLQARLREACERGASDVVTSDTIRGLIETAAGRISRERSPLVDSTPPAAHVSGASDSQPHSDPDVMVSNADRSVASAQRQARSPATCDDDPAPLDLLDADSEEAIEVGEHEHERQGGAELEEDAEAADAADGDVPEGGTADGNDADVRVPWLRYEDKPVRTRPRTDDPSSKEQRADAGSGPRSLLHEPLLTDEELRALLGDDAPEADAIETHRPPSDGLESEDQRL